MTIWRIRIACWMPKATNTHSEYVIFIALPLQQWLHERALVLRCTYIAFLVLTETVCVYCAQQIERLNVIQMQFLLLHNNNNNNNNNNNSCILHHLSSSCLFLTASEIKKQNSSFVVLQELKGVKEPILAELDRRRIQPMCVVQNGAAVLK
jgi:hypothetical protein